MDDIREKFDSRINSPTPNIVTLLAHIDELKGEFRADLNLTPQAITSLRTSVLVISTGASTRIEGARLSDEEVEKIMKGLSVSQFADRDTQEVQGYLETLENIFESFDSLNLSEGMILSLHNELLKYSTKDDLHRGEYKKKENTVGVLGPDGNIVRVMFETTKAYLTPKETRELLIWTTTALEKRRFHSLLIIGNFIIELLKVHPFEDGNGRLARVLTNLLLLKSGYLFAQFASHEQIIERRKDEYYLALRKSQETFGSEEETITPWLNFFLSVINEQAKKAHSYIQREQGEDTLSPMQQKVLKYISGVEEASTGDISTATGIVPVTVRQALNRLRELGMVKRIGKGRATRYIRIAKEE
ncbi:MAG: Fic family protein [Candidatus Paceibacterota bacterium]